jgi:micrococcal nuclease
VSSAIVLALFLVSASLAAAAGLEGRVVRVVDGDTIHVRVGERLEKVRYIGVNTPEVHHPRKGEEPGGREAMALNRRLVAGHAVRLETDVQPRDRYGRLLAYVWRGEVMVNAELVRRGYAQVMTIPPNVRHQALFLELQREARDAGRGLWGGDGPDAAPAPRRSRP